jgi:hypothetical protein
MAENFFGVALMYLLKARHTVCPGPGLAHSWCSVHSGRVDHVSSDSLGGCTGGVTLFLHFFIFKPFCLWGYFLHFKKEGNPRNIFS